ncbi:hypothetical protein IHA60_004735 [Salmonella enterica]|nr:hypothetical protein [Salmonella enterica]EBR1116744.1 hypothetical protein [Salmonella enterica]EGJ0356368.1 hypothetical protein [Salmonella enterica]EGL9173741.1 hypothetical protein [Salmonella enterica]EKS9279808.1 hypothetical protein [Salmonella enterica]
MKSRVLISLNFINSQLDICDLDNIKDMEKLINDNVLQDITEIIATEDWYFLTDEKTIFEFLAEHIVDRQRIVAILSKLNQLFGIYISDDINNVNAKHLAIHKNDDLYYYAVLSKLDVIQELNGCCIIKEQSDYKRLHIENLALCPESNEDYAKRCRLVFDKVMFLDDLPDTLSTLGDGQGIKNFSIPITHAINTLDNLDPSIRNIQSVMHSIQEKCGFECTPQGAKKGHLFKTVDISDTEKQKINCEFHVKISGSNAKDKKDYYSRIYFGLMPSGHKKYCLILHCGKHL